MSRRWHWYGAHPAHLLALLACFAFTGYVVAKLVHAAPWPGIVIWFLGAAVVHDFVLYPLYTLADTALRARSGPSLSAPLVPWRNHVRFPAAVSALLLLLWFPLIFGLSEATYTAASGLSTAPYLTRWLLITGVLFAGSALLYAWRWRWARRRSTSTARR